MPDFKCYLCDHDAPGAKWDAQTLKFILEAFKTCPTHKQQIEKALVREPGQEG